MYDDHTRPIVTTGPGAGVDDAGDETPEPTETTQPTEKTQSTEGS